MKRILITGVSRGLGLCIAEKLLENNYLVLGICRSNNQKLLELQKKYQEKLTIIYFDLSNCDQIESELFHKMLPLTLRIDGFVNNAAIAYDDLITNLQLDKLNHMFSVNVFSVMAMTKQIIRNMMFSQCKGSIVHVSSISVHTGYKGLSMYAATKGAIEAFSKNTAREWGIKGIRSNCLVAGFMETDMSSSLNDEQRKKIFSRNSLRQPTKIEDVASTIVYLLSSEASSITGQNVFVDSGSI